MPRLATRRDDPAPAPNKPGRLLDLASTSMARSQLSIASSSCPRPCARSPKFTSASVFLGQRPESFCIARTRPLRRPASIKPRAYASCCGKLPGLIEAARCSAASEASRFPASDLRTRQPQLHGTVIGIQFCRAFQCRNAVRFARPIKMQLIHRRPCQKQRNRGDSNASRRRCELQSANALRIETYLALVISAP